MTTYLGNSNKPQGMKFKHFMNCNKGYVYGGGNVHNNTHRGYFNNKKCGNHYKKAEKNGFNNTNIQIMKTEGFRKKRLEKETENFNREQREYNTSDVNNENSMDTMLKRKIEATSKTQKLSNKSNNVKEKMEDVMKRVTKEDGKHRNFNKNGRKEMIKLEDIERSLTNKTDLDYTSMQNGMTHERNERKRESVQKAEQSEEETEGAVKLASTHNNMLNLLMKNVSETTCVRDEETTEQKRKEDIGRPHETRNALLADRMVETNNVSFAKGKGKKQNSLDFTKIGNFYTLEQVEQTFYKALEEKNQKHKQENDATRADIDAHKKKKMGNEILNMLNKNNIDRKVSMERTVVDRQFFPVNGFHMLHSEKNHGKDSLTLNNRINGYNTLPNSYFSSNGSGISNSSSNNAIKGSNYIDRNIAFTRSNKKKNTEGSIPYKETCSEIGMMKTDADIKLPMSKFSAKDTNIFMESHSSAPKMEGVGDVGEVGIPCKSKNGKNEKVSKKKKGGSGLFVMPLFMRSPQPEQIPMPIYLSNEGTGTTKSQENKQHAPSRETENEKNCQQSSDVENRTLLKIEESIIERGVIAANINESNEKTWSFGSNNMGSSTTSNESGERSIKDILNFHLKQKHIANATTKSVDKLMHKKNENASNTCSNFYTHFTKETYTHADLSSKFYRNGKKHFKHFYTLRGDEFGLEKHCENGFFNKNRNFKQFKVDKHFNGRKFKARSNFYDGFKTRNIYASSSDVKIAAY